MARSNMISPMTCPLSTLISRESSISSDQKGGELTGVINTECLTQSSSLSKQDESQKCKWTYEVTHRCPTTPISKLPTRKQGHPTTFLSQVWISDTFKNNWHLCCILRQQVNKCTKVLTLKSSPTRESDQRGREEPELVLDPKWYVIFCTRRRSGRPCVLTLQLQKQDQEEYIHLEFVLHQ